MRVFIPGSVPSSKNSKVFTGKFLVHSKATQKYIKESKDFYMRNQVLFRGHFNHHLKPVIMLLHYVRKSRHKWDFDNATNTIFDVMQKYDWLPEDDASNVLPAPLPINGELWHYDKENPGVYIELMNPQDYINRIGGLT